jgi:hypothetical protein
MAQLALRYAGIQPYRLKVQWQACNKFRITIRRNAAQ